MMVIACSQSLSNNHRKPVRTGAVVQDKGCLPTNLHDAPSCSPHKIDDSPVKGSTLAPLSTPFISIICLLCLLAHSLYKGSWLRSGWNHPWDPISWSAMSRRNPDQCLVVIMGWNYIWNLKILRSFKKRTPES